MKYLVTGGAGFIGSHIVDRLMQTQNEVVVYDNLSRGKELFINQHLNNPRFSLVKGDILDQELLTQALKNVEFVFHLAAHADVKEGFENHEIDHEQNLVGTKNVLESMYKQSVKKIAFASTSSVYGDATIHPTPENYPFEPTSLYGASKASAETFIRTFASYYDWQFFIYRFVSFIGERYTHGIIFDIMKKLEQNSQNLQLFSDGTPKKSSMYVGDGIEAIFKVIETSQEKANVYNIGHDEVLTIDQIVTVILNKLDVKAFKNYQGGDKGWKGDNNFVNLDSTQLKKLGWSPTTSIKQGIEKTIDYLQSNPDLLQ